jgi:hypothetical protein
MPRNARVYDCLVISPGDVDAERDAIDGAVQFYNTVFGIHSGVVVQTSRWEYAAPDPHGPPQAVINRQIGDHCELGIAVFWSRLGTPTDEHDSGSIEEIERLLARGARVMVYHCVRDVPQDRLRDSQYPLLQAKLVELKQRGLVKEFRTTEELTKLVLGHLGSAIMQATKDEATAAALRGTPEVEPEVLFATELFYWETEIRLEACDGDSFLVDLQVLPVSPVQERTSREVGEIVNRCRIAHPVELASNDDRGPVPLGFVGASTVPGYREQWFASTTLAFFSRRELKFSGTYLGENGGELGLDYGSLQVLMAQSFALALGWSREAATRVEVTFTIGNVKGRRLIPVHRMPSNFVSRADRLYCRRQIENDWIEPTVTAIEEIVGYFGARGAPERTELQGLAARHGWRV